MSNFVFQVRYELDWEDDVQSDSRQRVSIKKYDAQLAVDKVKKDAMQSSRRSEEDGRKLKVTAFRLMSVDFVTDFD